MSQHRFGTRAIHAGQEPDPTTGAIMTPIYATSTYVQQSPGVHKGFDYARSHNPTRFAYERCIADLEGGTRGFAFASGLAATSTLLDLLDAGSHVIAGDDRYGGTFRLFERVRRRSAGLDFTFVDLADPEALQAALRPNTRMIWLESISNPMLKLVDFAAIAKFGREHGLLTVADNTFASPWLVRPLEYGFDVVMHSATKYLNGHSDIVGGVAVTREAELGEQVAFLQNAVGAIAGPFDSFLAMRGLKTLHLRMERHCVNARKVAAFLAQHPRVGWVNYPGSPNHPQYALLQKQMRSVDGAPGASGLLAFGVKAADGVAAGAKFIEAAQFMSHLANIGDAKTLIIHPASTTHRQLSEEEQAKAGVTADMIRLSVGIESIDDILWDIDSALTASQK